MAHQQMTALIGRQRHLETTGGWVTDLIAGRGRATFVEGEPGIGKSSLVRVAARQAAADGCQIFWGTCDELSQAFPLLPLLDALQSHTPAGSSIRDALRTDSAPGNRIDVVAKAAERLLALIDECCAAAPVMLVVDDLQFADPATVMTLGRLARSVRQLPLLLVGVARPVPRREDLHTLRRALAPDDVLTLPSLSPAEVAELVASAAGGTPGARLLRLAAGAAGNPLYVTELVDALDRARALVNGDGRVEVTGVRPPASLAAAIADRLEFLSRAGARGAAGRRPARRRLLGLRAGRGGRPAGHRAAAGARRGDPGPGAARRRRPARLPAPADPGRALRVHAAGRARRLAPRRRPGAGRGRRPGRPGRPAAAAGAGHRGRGRRGRRLDGALARRNRPAARRPGAAGRHPAAALGGQRHPGRRGAARPAHLPARRRALPGRRRGRGGRGGHRRAGVRRPARPARRPALDADPVPGVRRPAPGVAGLAAAHGGPAGHRPARHRPGCSC